MSIKWFNCTQISSFHSHFNHYLVILDSFRNLCG
ncbi:hypothetical protein E2C01_066049 [Portunus trituberculatus]|uniref:Uncharacterized protein n=1 Tax=Portunus trituberculatus TaxID=210409 RepID=A0A5B7HNR4_PORTR|nr:hypothetical protein [Portunus trituberculatus]